MKPTTAGHQSNRPALSADKSNLREATDAVARFVEELQAGWDHHDADLSNRHFATDIIWGSPFGASVDGYAELHPIHARLKRSARGGNASRFEIVSVRAPAPGVAVAQVRRVALGSDGQTIEPSHDLTASFSEMALYVLIRRDGVWWVVAGQNTPIRPA
ncbi:MULTISPECIES: SgcJ/EcaC family oxidoreductase [Paraburkholderia]|uniref:SgcJ/EcaC family oxidoreductase n=1 Tax=Paraburkholderia podalyriae TaxID=1938811 RepID=A0ABR7PKP0_9BURK|nr:SgcJ/EcaC family oxidoreductase [Paraburkholderia podalyriae]MBC8746929.1 SgcJ/EcaC family oxidoreductase [Paraburkholderia podalyriae]